MTDFPTITNQVRLAASKKILILPHAIRQMARPDRMIAVQDIRQAALTGEVIEDYPEDIRGHSCLILSIGQMQAIHLVCSPKEDYLAVITAYLPEIDQWDVGFRKRRSK